MLVIWITNIRNYIFSEVSVILMSEIELNWFRKWHFWHHEFNSCYLKIITDISKARINVTSAIHVNLDFVANLLIAHDDVNKWKKIALLVLCEGNPPVTGGFPSQKPVTRSLDGFFICAWTNAWANNRDSGDAYLVLQYKPALGHHSPETKIELNTPFYQV